MFGYKKRIKELEDELSVVRKLIYKAFPHFKRIHMFEYTQILVGLCITEYKELKKDEKYADIGKEVMEIVKDSSLVKEQQIIKED